MVTDEDRLCRESKHYSGDAEANAQAALKDRTVATCQKPCEIMSFNIERLDSARQADPSNGKMNRRYGVLVRAPLH